MSRGARSGSELRGLPLDQIRADFDRIAQVSEEGWNHSAHYYPELLRLLPVRIERALEVGCGIGDFTRQLSPRVSELVAIDLSPEMIRIARQRSAGLGQVRYEVADVMTWSAPGHGFDAVVAIATLHHLPYEAALARLASLVRPGGMLVVLEVWRSGTLADTMLSAAALPLSRVLRVVHGGPWVPSREARAAWAQHDRHDHVPTPAELRQVAARVLPEARTRRHGFWRFSIVWRRPA